MKIIKKIASTNGFTLVELVVVSAIVLVLGMIFTDVLVQTLRGENKVKIMAQVRQDGQTILDILADEIRLSEEVFCINDDAPNTDTIVLFRSGTYTRYRFTRPLPAGVPTTNGFISVDSWKFLQDAYASCNNPQTSSSKLTNDSTITGVSFDYHGGTGFTDKIFSRSTSPGFADSVTIKLRAFAGVGSGRAYETTVSENGVPFTTTISLRVNK